MKAKDINISKDFDKFFGRGFWEKKYKPHIIAFTNRRIDWYIKEINEERWKNAMLSTELNELKSRRNLVGLSVVETGKDCKSCFHKKRCDFYSEDSIACNLWDKEIKK